MSGVTQETIDTAIGYIDNMSPGLLAFKSARLIEQLWTDYQRLNARCQRLEGELIELRERLKVGINFDHVNPKYRRDFECINPNEPVESA